MKIKRTTQSAFLNVCIFIGLLVFFAGIVFALFAMPDPHSPSREPTRHPDHQPHGVDELGPAPAGNVYEAWVARYNGPDGHLSDVATAIAVDNSGNVYITGGSDDPNYGSYYATIKYNSAGQAQWAARYHGPGNSGDFANAIAVDNLGNVYVTGGSSGSTLEDYATIKYNSAGQQQWVARYNGPGNFDDVANAIAVDGAGNVYVTGGSFGSGTGEDYATIKYNSAGQQQWVARYNGPGNEMDEAVAIAVDQSGNVYVTGTSYGFGTVEDYATIKYNSAGQEQWVARYDGSGEPDEAAAIAVDGSGNVYVTGESFALATGIDYTTIKYDSAGQQQWMARYNGPGNHDDYATAIAIDTSGNVYVTGRSETVPPNYDYATVKYNASGQQQWATVYNGPANLDDEAAAIAVDSSGNVYVTGYSVDSDTDVEYATIKYDPAGQQQWLARYDGPEHRLSYATAIAIDSSDNVYVTGRSFTLETDYDYGTIKYGQGATPGPTPTGTPNCAPGSWQQVATNMPNDLYGAAGASDGTYSYHFGGYSFSQGQTLAVVNRYNPVNSTWTPMASMPQAAFMAIAVYYPLTNKIYVFGGADAVSGTFYNITRIYDIASNTWTTGTTMPDVRAFAAGGYIPATDTICLISGYNTGNVNSAQPNTWQYEPVKNTWDNNPLPFPHPAGGFAFGVINNKLYIAGGRDANNQIINLTWAYDPVANTYTQLADEPGSFQNNVPGSAAASGLLCVFGGGNPFLGNDAISVGARSINPPFNLNKPAFPWAVVGGIEAPSQPATSNNGRYYDPVTNTWTSSPNMNSFRSFPSGAAIGNNLIIAAGGYNGSTTIASAETEGIVCAPTPTPTHTPTPTPTASPTPTPTPTPCTGRCSPTPRPHPSLTGRPTAPPRLTPPPSASPDVTLAPRPTPPPRLTPPPTPTGSPRPTPPPRP